MKLLIHAEAFAAVRTPQCMLLADATTTCRTFVRIGLAEYIAAFLALNLLLWAEALSAMLAILNMEPQMFRAELLLADGAFVDVLFTVHLVGAIFTMASTPWAHQGSAGCAFQGFIFGAYDLATVRASPSVFLTDRPVAHGAGVEVPITE